MAFFDKDNQPIGGFTGQTGGDYYANVGIKFESAGADYAEYMIKINPTEVMNGGDIVGVYQGRISKNTKGADRIMVISTMPLVLGNTKPDKKWMSEPVAFVGQVPVKVKGKVESGDYVIASGNGDGIGFAVPKDKIKTDQLNRIVGQAWESSNEEAIKLVNVAIVPLDQPQHLFKELDEENKKLNSENKELKEELELLKNDIKAIKKALSIK